jgi:hypothetical protein
MNASATLTAVKTLAKEFKACKPSFDRDYGMRKLQEAKWLAGRNPEVEAERLATARHHLQFAKAR